MSLSERLQYLRKSKGFSQEELADKIGVSRQAVSKWESGQSLPDLEKIIIISDIFNVTTDYILKGTDTDKNINKKSDYSLYLGFSLMTALIAGVFSFTANRFRTIECFFIIIAGAAIGLCIGLIIKAVSRLFSSNM